jgi:hypothetical protein
MNTYYNDYESMGMLNFALHRPVLTESFSGTAIVKWQGKIESQLVNLLGDSEKGRNYPYADKLREFLKIWRANEITGSLNRETLEILKSACDILAVDQWDMNKYFGSLRDQLRVLVASEEQLPRGMEEPGADPMAGGHGGGGGGAPPMSPSFGADKDGPEDGAGGGGAGGAGGDLGGLGGPPPPGGPEGGAPGGGVGPDGKPLDGAEGGPDAGGAPGEAPGAEPGAPSPEGQNDGEPEPEDMPGDNIGTA